MGINQPPPGSEYVSRAQAAKILNVSVGTVHRYITRGWLTKYVLANGYYVVLKRADVEALASAEPVRVDK